VPVVDRAVGLGLNMYEWNIVNNCSSEQLQDISSFIFPKQNPMEMYSVSTY